MFRKALPLLACATLILGLGSPAFALTTPSPVPSVSDVTVNAVPNAPIGLYTPSTAIGSMSLSWINPSSNSAAGVTDYIVQYKKTTDASWSTFADGVSTTTKATVTGLAASTQYNFRVAAVNSSGTSAYTPSITVLSHASGIPNTPTNIIGTAPTPTSIYLTWTAPTSMNGGTLNDYVVLYKLNTATTWSTWDDGVSTKTSTTVTGLTAGARYQFKVASKSNNGTSGYTTLITVGTVVTYTPGSIATVVGAGDSISRGFDVNVTCALKDCPQYSWSTGVGGTSGNVNSMFNRIKILNGANTTTALNVAKTGSKVSDLDRQLKLVPTGAKTNVNIMVGANDLCTSTTASMTTTAAFTTSFDTALSNYIARNPDAKIFVSSIPNINGLYNTFKTSSLAQLIWKQAGICPTVLSSTAANSATRAAVASREAEFNNVLKTLCTEKFVSNCRWDNLTMYNYTYMSTDVSTVDYFHPSVLGQTNISNIAWKSGFWGV